ncbi:hypothetical protein NN561_002484 [Cricetulus griseus]
MNEGSWEGRNNRACPVCVLVEPMGAEGTRSRGRTPEKGSASTEWDSIPRRPGRRNDNARTAPEREHGPGLQPVRGGGDGPGPAPLTCGPRAATTGRKCQPSSSPPVRSSRPSPSHFRGRSRPLGGFYLSGV